MNTEPSPSQRSASAPGVDPSFAESEHALIVSLEAALQKTLQDRSDETTFRLRVLLEMVMIELAKLEKRKTINKN
ncbi:hypothetical protein GCM10007884_29390 [Methylobacterium brachythecii]|nr:hypothetical protein GCM10007884_29390 [Methylobacterium brachythecii]